MLFKKRSYEGEMHTNATVYPHNSDNSNNTVTAFGDSFVIKKKQFFVLLLLLLLLALLH